MNKLKILGRITSINVRKVVWLADELGLSYEREDWGLPIRDPKVPEFLSLNPNGQVPVIIEDDFVLWESGAIMRYLATQRGSDLWPENLREHALVDQWLTWQATDLGPTWLYAFLALARKMPGFDDPDRIKESITRWGKAMAILEAQLQADPRAIANSRFSLADIALGVSVHRWFAVPFERPELPAVSAYYKHLKAREAGAAYLGDSTP